MFGRESLAELLVRGGCWLALLQALVCRLLFIGFRTLAEFFFSFGNDESPLRLCLVDAVVVVVVSSTSLFVPPKVHRFCLTGAVSSEAAFFNFSCSTLLLPADPFSFRRGPGVFAKAFATLVFVGAKWFAPTTLTLPDSYFYRLFKMSVRTFVTVR